MADESTDVLMTFIQTDGSGLEAECASKWNSADSMSNDFTTGTFFELEDFSFGGGLELTDDSARDKFSAGSNGSERSNELTPRDDPGKQGKEGGKDRRDRGERKCKAASGGRGTKFEAYVQGLNGWEKKLKLDVPEISVSRQMDKCSPLLFQSCMTMQAFRRAVIVKRKIIGNLAARRVNVPLMGYLRFEFDQPLITSIDWEDGDIIKEKFKFVCRGIRMIYKPQDPNGSLGKEIPATWKAKGSPQTGGSSSPSKS